MWKKIEKHCFLHWNAASRKMKIYKEQSQCSNVNRMNAAESFAVFHRKHQPHTERSVLLCFVKCHMVLGRLSVYC